MCNESKYTLVCVCGGVNRASVADSVCLCMHLLFTRLPNLNAYNWRQSSEGSNRIPLALWPVVHNTLSSLYMKEWGRVWREWQVQSSTAHHVVYRHVLNLVYS